MDFISNYYVNKAVEQVEYFSNDSQKLQLKYID